MIGGIDGWMDGWMTYNVQLAKLGLNPGLPDSKT